MQLHMDQPTYDPCFPQNETFTKAEQNELHKAKSMANEREQFMVDTPLGAYIASICQPKASSDLSFAAQSSAVAWEKEYPSQKAYTTFFTDRRYHNQDQGRNYDRNGRNFSRKGFKQYASTMGINTEGVPIKAYNSIGKLLVY